MQTTEFYRERFIKLAAVSLGNWLDEHTAFDASCGCSKDNLKIYAPVLKGLTTEDINAVIECAVSEGHIQVKEEIVRKTVYYTESYAVSNSSCDRRAHRCVNPG